MAKPSTNYRPSELTPAYVSPEGMETPEIKVDSGSGSLYNLVEEEVQLRSLFDGRLEYTGQVTGKRYTWNKAGSIAWVSELDALFLLEKRIGKQACCGDSKDGSALFEQVK